jgi:hypothetical protein
LGRGYTVAHDGESAVSRVVILIGNVIAAANASVHTRTAMGFRSKSKLFLFLVDGLWPGYSEGMTAIEDSYNART